MAEIVGLLHGGLPLGEGGEVLVMLVRGRVVSMVLVSAGRGSALIRPANAARDLMATAKLAS